MENLSINSKMYFFQKEKQSPGFRESFATDLLCELRTSYFAFSFPVE